MGVQIKPMADTQRIIGWDELPLKVRQIPEGFDPTESGLMMKHQVEWLMLDAQIKVAEKGRRTGVTFAEAHGSTLTAASTRSAGGDNIYYVGDTKDKGLEFVGYCAKFAKLIAQAQGQGVSGIEEFLFEDQQPDGKTKNITAYRIRFSSGFSVTALSSNPSNIRGLQGIVVIDEAAFHRDVDGVIESSLALLIWGGKIRIISTHNTKKSAFNQLIKDIKAGLYGKNAKVYKVTFDDAVANGLYERVCFMQRKKPTKAGKKEWYNGIRNAYGPRQAAMREELDAIPRDGGGVSIPGVWIDNAMKEKRAVLRWTLGEDFAKLPTTERTRLASEWIKKFLTPELNKLRKDRKHVFGMDYARHRDFTEYTPAEIQPDLTRFVPFILELHNVPTRQQEQILWAMIDGLPRFVGGAMDATGPGQTIAEYTADRYGRPLIQEVMLSVAWYTEWMPKMVDLFEDGMIDLPADDDVQGDLRAVEDIDGVPRVPTIRTKDLKDPSLHRHGDSAIAIALMNCAVVNQCAEIDYIAGPGKRGRWDGKEDDEDEDDFNDFQKGAW